MAALLVSHAGARHRSPGARGLIGWVSVRILALLLVLPLLAACAPAAPSPPAAASAPAGAAASPTDPWAELVRAAEQEGRLRLLIPPGEARREALQHLQTSYPGVQLELDSMHIRDALSRVLAEREAGIYLYDAMIGAIGADVFQQWIPRGVLAPLEPSLVLPEVLDDGKWRDGFGGGWVDSGRQHVYGYASNASTSITVNRDLIPERELPNVISFDDLLDPRWKGKIAWDDPRQPGSGVSFATLIQDRRGEEFLRRLFVEQEIVPTADNRQLAEWVIRGRYPIGFSVSNVHVDAFQREGLGRNLVDVKIRDAGTAATGFGAVSLFSQAPRPRAAALFANWMLSREGQTKYTALSLENSRRLDVPPVDPVRALEPGVHYVNPQHEEFAPIRTRTAQIAREVIR
jgi:ABC-type Fe3+ transport system substrate-binding protein